MKHSIPCRQVAGFLVTAVLGTFLHFLFDLTGSSLLAGLFSAVNESIWEHMKLLFYPMLLFALVEYRLWGKSYPGYWCVRLMGILLGLTLIPVMYYTYTGILGTSVDWFNITIFFMAAAAAYWAETKLFLKEHPCSLPAEAAVAALLSLAVVFSLLTFFPPRIPFFRDPVTGTYGYQQFR